MAVYELLHLSCHLHHVTSSPEEPECCCCRNASQFFFSMYGRAFHLGVFSKYILKLQLDHFQGWWKHSQSFILWEVKRNLKISLFPFFFLFFSSFWLKPPGISYAPSFGCDLCCWTPRYFITRSIQRRYCPMTEPEEGPFLLHLCSLFFATWGKLRELLVWITTRSQTQGARVSEELVQTGRPSDHLRDSAAEHPLWSCGCLICGSSTEVKNTFFATSHTLVWFLQAV